LFSHRLRIIPVPGPHVSVKPEILARRQCPADSTRDLEKLNLTDAQKEQIHPIVFNLRDATREYDGKIRAASEQLRMMVEGGNFTDESAQPFLKTKTDALMQTELLRLRADAAIIKILTSEQKAQLVLVRERRPPSPPGGGFRPDG
jgi:Spy/CpxP family protein refolding chaperone